ncbi:hypothetical protein [Cohaesibacter marisflavi]|uniref:hypothetical protein n=1 Tax=Cohaesibacter marisflavi TaxID=655353 RepID=UPI0029C8C863|nr:hypothetical protein [Cohaesibacter marisflavi]
MKRNRLLKTDNGAGVIRKISQNLEKNTRNHPEMLDERRKDHYTEATFRRRAS